MLGKNRNKSLNPFKSGHEDAYLKLHVKITSIIQLMTNEVMNFYIHNFLLNLTNVEMFESKVERGKCPTTFMLWLNPNKIWNLVKNGYEVCGLE